MLELQKIFLLVRFFNQISCNKGLKAKISCFLCFFCLTPLGLECSRSRKTASFLMSHRLKKYKNLHPRSFTSIFEGKLQVLSVIWVKWKWSVCSITLLYSSTFCTFFLACFYNFLFRRYLNSSMTRFWSDILPSFLNSNDLNSCAVLL